MFTPRLSLAISCAVVISCSSSPLPVGDASLAGDRPSWDVGADGGDFPADVGGIEPSDAKVGKSDRVGPIDATVERDSGMEPTDAGACPPPANGVCATGCSLVRGFWVQMNGCPGEIVLWCKDENLLAPTSVTCYVQVPTGQFFLSNIGMPPVIGGSGPWRACTSEEYGRSVERIDDKKCSADGGGGP
jgi:hypothetical protein